MTAYEHVIVGAGIIGLTTAFELVRRGVDPQRIALVDPAPASGATNVAGGMLAPAAEVQYRQEPLYPLMLQSAELYPSLVADLVAAAAELPAAPTTPAVDVGYRTESTFVVAADRADATHLRELTEHQHTHGMDVDRLTLRQARAQEPGLSPQLAGVVEIPGDHQVNPRMFAATLLRVLDHKGVTLVREETTALLWEGSACVGVEVGVEKRKVLGATTYVCNGLGARALGLPLNLRPVRGDMLRLGAANAPVGRVIRAFVEDRPVYIIPRTDGTIAVGATSREDARERPAVDGVYTLLRDAIRIVPGLEDCELIEALVGNRPGTPDDLPYLGLGGENLVVSTGYFRHGILLAALGARVGADLGLRRTTAVDIAACDPARHE